MPYGGAVRLNRPVGSARTGGLAAIVLLAMVLAVLSIGARAGASGRCAPLDPTYGASWRTATVRSAGCHAWLRLHRHHHWLPS
jgi:hypothetical protein